MDLTVIATGTVALLTPYLVKMGETAAEKIGEALPDSVGQVWTAVTARFKGKPAAEEAVKDLTAKPTDDDTVAGFRKELKKALEADPAFAQELERLMQAATSQSGAHVVNTGSGAIATHGGVVAGAGGVAVQGDVHGGIHLGISGPKKG